MGAANLLLDECSNICIKRIHAQVCAIFTGKIKLAFINIYCNNMSLKYILGILQGKVPKPAQAGDQEPFARMDAGFLDSLIRSHACAGN